MRALIGVLILAFATVVLWVTLANWGEEVTMSLGVGEPRSTTLSNVIFGSVVSGVLFIGVLALIEGLALRVENLKLRRRMGRLEEEIFDLRQAALNERTARLDELPAPPSDRVRAPSFDES